MAPYWDVAEVHGAGMKSGFVRDAQYDSHVEHAGQLSASELQPFTMDETNDATPKPIPASAQGGYLLAGFAHQPTVNHGCDPAMSTPPLSPSTTISSLPTEESNYLSDEQTRPHHEDREEIRRGKQPALPTPEKEVYSEYAQDDSDWYGMEYALEQSRYEYPGSAGVWPPTAGESSTSDAAFVTMYDGYIYPQDVSYWYEHWRKWHRALAREERRRRDRAASDAKRMRVYNHATYVEWERAQNKKRTGNIVVGSKPMTSTRHRSSTCLF